jgi:hypothetical protein
MTPIIRKIRIRIGPEGETFALDRELLVGRSAAVKRVRGMRELAQAFLRDRGPLGGSAEFGTSDSMNFTLFPMEPNRIALDDLEFPSLDLAAAIFQDDCDALPLQATEIGDPLLESANMGCDDGFGGSM